MAGPPGCGKTLLAKVSPLGNGTHTHLHVSAGLYYMRQHLDTLCVCAGVLCVCVCQAVANESGLNFISVKGTALL